jgi:hypothetical protein
MRTRPHRWRATIGIIGLASVVWTLAAGAQGAAPLALKIEPATLTRDRVTVVTFTVEIPEGRFIPAETRGGLQGAWLQPTVDWFDAGELPTFPMPEEVHLRGSGVPLLAYRGTIGVRLPVDVWGGVTGENELVVRFGYQLCDMDRCAGMQTIEARASFQIQEPSTPEDALAFRVDSSRIAIVLNRQSPTDRGLTYTPMSAQVGPIAVLPRGHVARSAFSGDASLDSRWYALSDGPAFAAGAEQPAALHPDCADTMSLALIARIADRSFSQEGAKYFLARPALATAGPVPSLPSLAMKLVLTQSQRRDLEDLIERQLRITLPSVFAPSLMRYQSAPETADDRIIRDGHARMTYHMEAFKLAPDSDPRLFVRAYWRVADRSQTGLTLWIRLAGQRFLVERSNARVTTFAHLEESRSGSDLAASASSAGVLLNVVPASDGWSYLIIGRSGYESRGVSVWKYSPNGPLRAGIEWGSGC